MNELFEMSSELCKRGSSLTQRVRPSMDLWMQPLSIRVRRSRGGYDFCVGFINSSCSSVNLLNFRFGPELRALTASARHSHSRREDPSLLVLVGGPGQERSSASLPARPGGVRRAACRWPRTTTS